MKNMRKVIIIGAGITGLSTAYYLQEKAGDEIDFIILEKRDRPGGVIVTERIDGFIIEGGPDTFVSEKPWTVKLSKELGIEDRLLNSNEDIRKTFIFSDGKLRELPEGIMMMVPIKVIPFLKSDLISWPGKIRACLDLFLPRKNYEDESLESFVKRRLGKEILEKIAEPLIAGIHACEPENMSLKSTFPRFIEYEKNYGSLIRGMLAAKKEMETWKNNKSEKKLTFFMSFKGGMQELVDALVSALAKNIFLNKKVTRVDKIETSETIKYLVHVEGNSPILADAVVFTTPSYITAKILGELDKSLANKLNEITWVSSATISLGYKKSDINHPLKGFGFVVPRVENRKIKAVSWNTSKFNYRAPEGYVLLRCFIGGPRKEDYVDLDDESLIKLAREELKEIMGIDAEPVITRVYRWKKEMPQYKVGHSERVKAIEEMSSKHPGLYITGSSYYGVGIGDCIRCGELTAEKIIEQFKKSL